VTLLTIEGGGHTWPGGAQYLPRGIIGRVCRDFDASERIWAFFAAHPKPEGKPATARM
jgi:polyhydroxybutyrate depolymerase